MEDTQQPVEQQVTSKTPATRQKNPKRVAAGKAVAERTRIARGAEKGFHRGTEHHCTNKTPGRSCC